MSIGDKRDYFWPNSLLVQERMISILSEMGRFFFGNTQSVHIQRFMHFVDMHLFFGT